MKIVINEQSDYVETEVIINCQSADEDVVKIISLLHSHDNKLTGSKDGKTHIIEPDDVLYFDSVDRKTFIYTTKEVYESSLKLYEVEERFSARQFFRSSKSTIINIAKIISIMPHFNGRLEISMLNGEKLLVSRQYANELKAKIGL